MAIDVILLLAGVALVWLTLSDVFETVVVPGGSRASLQVTRHLRQLFLPIWRRLRGPKKGISGTFAPFILVGSFVIWMILLAIAFGMMAFALRSHFDPPLKSYADAVYEVGSSLVTVGLSTHYPVGLGRWLILAAGFCGLAVMTMAVTYLLEVQSSIARRDIGIIKLNTSAGDPPSGLTLLERFAALRNERALLQDLEDGRNWCATVRQSHSAHPSLIYFRSISSGAGWPAALGALLDVALMAEHLLDDDRLYGPAILLREEGTRMARELATVVRLAPKYSELLEGELIQLSDRLASSGYRLRDKPNFATMSNQRREIMSCVDALAEHLGSPTAVLIRQA